MCITPNQAVLLTKSLRRGSGRPFAASSRELPAAGPLPPLPAFRAARLLGFVVMHSSRGAPRQSLVGDAGSCDVVVTSQRPRTELHSVGRDTHGWHRISHATRQRPALSPSLADPRVDCP